MATDGDVRVDRGADMAQHSALFRFEFPRTQQRAIFPERGEFHESKDPKLILSGMVHEETKRDGVGYLLLHLLDPHRWVAASTVHWIHLGYLLWRGWCEFSLYYLVPKTQNF